jgi:hypothetical protein
MAAGTITRGPPKGSRYQDTSYSLQAEPNEVNDTLQDNPTYRYDTQEITEEEALANASKLKALFHSRP